MMQLTSMPIWLFATFAVALAGALAALHLLRIRPRRQRVVTTLFWQQASEQSQARTLIQRFRHKWTYLLLLLIGLLVLLALAKPVITAGDGSQHVIVLEAGLEMTADDDRFERAVSLVRAEARSHPESDVAVLVADPAPRVLKSFDESMTTFESRLAGIKPAETPVAREALLRLAYALAGNPNPITLVTAGPTNLDPKGIRVLSAGEPIENAFVLSSNYVTDREDLTRGDLHFRVGFSGSEQRVLTIRVTREGVTLMEQSTKFEPQQDRLFKVPDLHADGRMLNVEVVDHDLIAADNRFDFRLPDRRQIHLAPVEGFELPEVLSAMAEGFAELSLGETPAKRSKLMRVGPPGSAAEIVVTPADPQSNWQPARVAGHPLTDGLSFEDSVVRAAAQPTAGTPLLLAGNSPIVSLDANGKRINVAATLFDPESNLIRRAAYPVFWSVLLHHLAGWQDEPLTLTPEQSSRITDLGEAHVLKADIQTATQPVANKAEISTPLGASIGLPLWQWLLLGGLTTMFMEAILHLRGKIV